MPHHAGFACGGFDFAFFLLHSRPWKPFIPPLIRMSRLAVFTSPWFQISSFEFLPSNPQNCRSTLIFDHSLQTT